MSTQNVTVPPLNSTQALAILEEAKNRGMMEGSIPTDEAFRQQYASQLVAHAMLAFENGNQDEAVMAVLFNAEVDMSPSIPVPPPQAPVAAPPPGPAAAPPPGAPPAAPSPVAPQASSFDLSTMSDDTITGMITALEQPQYESQPNVQQELATLKEEQARRAAGGGQVAQAAQPQAVAPPAQAPAPTAPPAPPVAAAAPPAPPTAPQTPVPPGPPLAPPEGGAPPAPAAPPAADAPAAPGPQAPQPAVEGDLAAATPEQEAAEKAQLEGQLNLAQLQAWGVDPAAVPTLSLDTLRGIVANPGGPVATDTAASPSPESVPVNAQREALIAQITGPILKAYGRGRKEIADIGEQELALMVSLPEGNVTMEQLMGARQADGVSSSVLPPALRQPAAPPAPLAPPPGTPGAPPPAPVAPAPPAPSAAPSAFAPAAPEQPQAAAPPPPPPAPPTAPPAAPQAPAAPVAPAPVQVAPVQPQMAPPAGAPPIPVGDGNERAMQIISQENMPIPPEIEGDPPRLPNDLSKVSDQELQSFHARFHACESRANWVISQFDDEIGGVKKLLRDRRREVAGSIGTVDSEGKKLTKDAKEVLIESDVGVQQYVHQLEEIEKTVGKLKVLRDNYHQDVSTCSRQWSMRSGEADKQPVPR